MNDHYTTLDQTVAAIKAECAERLSAMKDKLLAAEIEATLAKDQLKEARAAELQWQRVATKLVTQFAVVEAVFADAKALALAAAADPPDERLPKNELTLTEKREIESLESNA